MKLKHKLQLKSLKDHELRYGFISLNDLKCYHHLRLLPKIIKLKKANRVLISKRKSLQEEILTKAQSVGCSGTIALLTKEVANMSEQIGKNSCKIMQLRTRYCDYTWMKN